jgi:hypothetical protein
MPRGKAATSTDQSTLQMALVGYEVERARIEGKIREIQAQLGTGKSAAAPSASKGMTAPKKRVLSAAARKRIAAAQRKRWAEHRKNAAASKA